MAAVRAEPAAAAPQPWPAVAGGLRLSVIVPVLNEGATLPATLVGLQGLRRRGHEVLVVDGGSEDDTTVQAAAGADAVLAAPRGRALQMNAGAARAHGEVLVFLHADTQLPAGADALIEAALAGRGRHWGRFDIRLSGGRPVFRLIETAMNLRSRLTGIATGDQVMFVRRTLFERVGGFPPIALMEDIALSARLRQCGPPACLRPPVLSSSRRWERGGIWRTILLMWRLRLAWFYGAAPTRLARLYARH